MLFCQECRDYALFDVEFYAEFLEEILRYTQNFGRNSAEKIGHWSLCSEGHMVGLGEWSVSQWILGVMRFQKIFGLYGVERHKVS